MQENTNKIIAFNSVILYGKTIVNTICALLTTRFALHALGVVDYGLYAVLGGVVSFMGIFNTIMLSTSNRFIAVAIGKGNESEVNRQFNVNLVIHVAIAFVVLMMAFPIGDWYIPRFINYDGSMEAAMLVYRISILGSVFSFVGVPYNGVLMAKEKFVIFSLVEVITHIVKLLVAWILIYYFAKKLLIYSMAMAIMAALPTIVYILFCRRQYPNIVQLRIVRDRKMYKNVFGFSTWVAVGAVAQVGKNQGAALVVNVFFDTIMNTAMGVANSINSYVGLFAQNITQPMAPQITKSYAAGNHQRTDELLIMSAKYSFMLTFLIGSFFLVEPDWILGLWLGDTPPYASIFLILLVTDNVIRSLNSGVANLLFASGKIVLFQIIVSMINVLSVTTAYFVLRGGAQAYYLLVTYICFSIIMFFAIQFSLHRTLHYDTKQLWKQSYLPCITTALLFVPSLFLPDILPPIVKVVVSSIYLCGLEYFICLSKKERKKISQLIKNIHKHEERSFD